MDVPDGTDRRNSFAKRVYRCCGVADIPVDTDVYFVGFASRIKTFQKTLHKKYIYFTCIDRLFVCYNGMDTVVVYVRIDLGEIVAVTV